MDNILIDGMGGGDAGITFPNDNKLRGILFLSPDKKKQIPIYIADTFTDTGGVVRNRIFYDE